MGQSTNGYSEAAQAEDGNPDLGDFLSSAMADGKEYLAAEKEYLTLRAYEKVGKAAGSLFSSLLSALAVLMFLFFASVALAFWAGTWADSTALGFLIVGGGYLLVFIVIHFMARKAIRGPIMLSVINSFYDDKD